MSAFLRPRLHILALLALAAMLIGQLGSLFWPAELFSHFLPHYAAIFILAAFWPCPKWRVLWLVCTAASLLWLAQPFTLPDAPAGGTRLVWYNVHLDNPAAKAESTALLAEQADFIALGEINLDNPGCPKPRIFYCPSKPKNGMADALLTVSVRLTIRPTPPHCFPPAGYTPRLHNRL